MVRYRLACMGQLRFQAVTSLGFDIEVQYDATIVEFNYVLNVTYHRNVVCAIGWLKLIRQASSGLNRRCHDTCE